MRVKEIQAGSEPRTYSGETSASPSPPSALLPLFPAFTLARYRFTLEALEPLRLPPCKGSVLRGGFGYTFKRLVCLQPRQCSQQCQLGNACPYGYIFETSPLAEAEVLRTFSEIPRPFIIEPPDDRRTFIPAGERLSFHLILIGQGMPYLPYFVAVFRELGRIGLGSSQGRYRLLAVEAAPPYQDRLESVYQAQAEPVLQGASAAISSDAIAARAAALSAGRLTLHFITPTRLKHQGRWVEQGPPFAALVKTLFGRISSLSYFHCGERFEADFRGLIDRAANVRIEQNDTRWEDWSRFSGRQQQRIEMGGLVGRVTYTGDLADYLPLLALGELVHVGKGTVFGNGQYRIITGISSR